MAKTIPTDSEQLLFDELYDISLIVKDTRKEAEEWRTKIWQLIQERDQQRLSAALEALPKKQDEHPIDPETGAAVEVYGYEETFNQAIDQCTAALTAALGPDNSKIEE
jgi:hypothetical protein